MTPKHMPTPIPASSGIESGQQQFVKDLASIGIVPTNGDQGMVNEGERLCGEMASGNTREKRLLLYLKLQRFCGSVKRRATQKTFSVRSTDLLVLSGFGLRLGFLTNLQCPLGTARWCCCWAPPVCAGARPRHCDSRTSTFCAGASNCTATL